MNSLYKFNFNKRTSYRFYSLLLSKPSCFRRSPASGPEEELLAQIFVISIGTLRREGRSRAPSTMKMWLFLVVVFAVVEGSCGASNQHQTIKRRSNAVLSSVVFPVTGDVYPTGYYQVTLNIGHPPKPYFLDIDSGSDLTWLQCDAPCIKCTPAPHELYKPNRNLVPCNDPLCVSLQSPNSKPCESPNDQCDYEIEYADHGSSVGVLVRDSFTLGLTNGTFVGSQLIFGCGYNQEVPNSIPPPYTDGVLGLAGGKSSIVSQLHELGLTRNVFGHCLSGKGGGFLFFGDDLVPSSGVAWSLLMRGSFEKHYVLGPADLLYGKQPTGVEGLQVVFDSGSTYTYFNSNSYKATLTAIKKDLKGKKLEDAVEDRSLPVCWKGAKPFKSISDVRSYFKPLVLRFTKAKNIELQLPPEAYLIITKHRNVCLGVLNGAEVGLGNLNIIGDISLQDKMVIYDNERKQMGWAPANCDRLPNVDGDYGEFQPYALNMGIFDRGSAASRASSSKEL